MVWFTIICDCRSSSNAVPRNAGEGSSFFVQHNWRRQMLIGDRNHTDLLRRLLQQLRRSENSSSLWPGFTRQGGDPRHRVRLLYRVRRLGETAGRVWESRSGSRRALQLHLV